MMLSNSPFFNGLYHGFFLRMIIAKKEIKYQMNVFITSISDIWYRLTCNGFMTLYLLIWSKKLVYHMPINLLK